MKKIKLVEFILCGPKEEYMREKLIAFKERIKVTNITPSMRVSFGQAKTKEEI